MIDIKLSLTVELPGSTMVSTQSCVKNGEPDVSMFDKNVVKFLDNKNNLHRIDFLTRKCIPARKHINICREAYEYFISSEEPEGYRDYRIGKHWKNMSKSDRLEWHLKSIAESFGGKLVDYHVFED